MKFTYVNRKQQKTENNKMKRKKARNSQIITDQHFFSLAVKIHFYTVYGTVCLSNNKKFNISLFYTYARKK